MWGKEGPSVFDESKIQKFWKDEPFDEMLPKLRGYISDYVLSLRGTEVPTIYCIWTALFTLASAIKREAWLEWFPDKIYPNLYMILVGPPSISHKTTAIEYATSILQNQINHIENFNFKYIKDLNILKDKATPEAILEQMIPSKKGGGYFNLIDKDGRVILDEKNQPLKYDNTSEVSIIIEELTSSINQTTYAQSLIETLTAIYNTRKTYEWTTIKRDKVTLVNLCTSFIGGTTISALRDSIPKQAKGDGFLSRTILVDMGDKNIRRYKRAMRVPNGPKPEDIEKRLAWIAENITKEYSFSKEADEYYGRWYNNFRDDLENNPSTIGIYGRKGLNVLKVALLISAARYNTTRLVSIEDFQAADELITKTILSTPDILSSIDEDVIHRKISTIRDYIKKSKEVQRRIVMRNHHLTSKEIDIIIDHLYKDGSIKIISPDGLERRTPSGSSKEIYKYVMEEPTIK